VAAQAAPQPSADPAPIDIALAPPAAVAAARLAETPPPPTPAQALAKLIYKETPNFPPEAVLQGVTSGNVKVRLNIDGKGAVSKVIIVESRPRKLFDKAVIRALNRWQFEPTGEPQIVETEVVFTVDNQ
jgi:protein TonB